MPIMTGIVISEVPPATTLTMLVRKKTINECKKLGHGQGVDDSKLADEKQARRGQVPSRLICSFS